MNLTREELLRQKALVEEQLRWIDAKLAESGDDASPEVETSVTPAPQPVVTPAPAASTPVTPIAAGTSTMDFSSDGPAEGITSEQKVGCFILVVLVCAGILAALFLLPYLLY